MREELAKLLNQYVVTRKLEEIQGKHSGNTSLEDLVLWLSEKK